MSESVGIDSPVRGQAMPQSYSGDLRERAIGTVGGGGVSMGGGQVVRNQYQFDDHMGSGVRTEPCRENAATTSDMPDMCQFDRLANLVMKASDDEAD
jgi:hypothetical protein